MMKSEYRQNSSIILTEIHPVRGDESKLRGGGPGSSELRQCINPNYEFARALLGGAGAPPGGTFIFPLLLRRGKFVAEGQRRGVVVYPPPL